MWRLVREGLRVYRPILLSAWTTSTLGVAAVIAVLALVGVVDGRRALSFALFALPLYLLHASAVVGWIAIGTELSEHRLRLHALLPLPLARLALAQLLLPSTMLFLGLPLAHAATALAQAVYGARSPWLGHAALDLVAAHLLVLLQLTLAAKEVTVLRETVWWRPWVEGPAAARRRRGSDGRLRSKSEPAGGVTLPRGPARQESHAVTAGAVLAVLGWFVVLALLAAEAWIGWPDGNLVLRAAGVAALAALTAALTVALFCRRGQITR